MSSTELERLLAQTKAHEEQQRVQVEIKRKADQQANLMACNALELDEEGKLYSIISYITSFF